MSDIPQLWLLAGGNGAGKSTFYRDNLKELGVPFINADILAKEMYPDSPEMHSLEAAKFGEKMRYELLREKRSFCFETVFSHPSKIDFIADAKTLGYEVVLVFIHLETPELNQARVSQRVSEGGHSVPSEKIISRIPRALNNIKETLPLCDHVYLLDNSQLNDPFVQVATIKNQKIISQLNPLPVWVEELLNQ